MVDVEPVKERTDSVTYNGSRIPIKTGHVVQFQEKSDYTVMSAFQDDVWLQKGRTKKW